MLITSDFVLLNYPKTGSTYSRNRIKEIYSEKGIFDKILRKTGISNRYVIERFLPITRTLSAQKAKRKSQHGAYCQIPREHIQKPIYSVIRNPYDLYVSQYAFGAWIMNSKYIFDFEEIKMKYPNWPTIQFHDFIEISSNELVNDLLCNKPLTATIGKQSLNFIKFFAKDPEIMVSKLSDEYIDSDEILSEFKHINFLRNESLNSDLRNMLMSFGHNPNSLDSLNINTKDNVSSKRIETPWQDYYDDELKNRVKHLERLLFRLFPEYDI